MRPFRYSGFDKGGTDPILIPTRRIRGGTLSISWDARASLHRAGVRQLAPGQCAILWTDEVWDGSLATMLCEWLSKPEGFQPLYAIFVQGDAGTRRVLDHRDMEALVKRADFPAKRLAAA
jgi:hypothetical protein